VIGADVSNSCYIGNIFGQSVDPATATFAIVDTNGKLGTQLSSRRFKQDIKPMDEASEAILALKPVTFHYKSDTKGTPQFGLIAEEVAEVSPDLVVRDKNGEILTVRYDQVNAMLLNEFLKEHKRMEELKSDFQATIAQQQKEIQALTAQLKEQATQIQKVSARIETSGPAPKVVLNNP
jgi:DNA-directed RNA polymerase specialized sigma54-like protein